jgi:hypothetical protein
LRLTRGFGKGVGALRAIQTSYTAPLLGFFAAAYFCMRELLGESRARDATLILAFTPLALYFSHKTLRSSSCCSKICARPTRGAPTFALDCRL